MLLSHKTAPVKKCKSYFSRGLFSNVTDMRYIRLHFIQADINFWSTWRFWIQLLQKIETVGWIQSSLVLSKSILEPFLSAMIIRIIYDNMNQTDQIFVFGWFWSPREFSAYYTPLSKSCQFRTLINAFGTERHGKMGWENVLKWVIAILSES